MFLAYGGSKHIKAATILELQPSAEGIGRKGKMADGDVGLAHALERLAQIALVHRGDAKDAKLATGKMGHGAILSHKSKNFAFSDLKIYMVKCVNTWERFINPFHFQYNFAHFITLAFLSIKHFVHHS